MESLSLAYNEVHLYFKRITDADAVAVSEVNIYACFPNRPEVYADWGEGEVEWNVLLLGELLIECLHFHYLD